MKTIDYPVSPDLTPELTGGNCIIWLDGRDVTENCVYANPKTGVVDRYVTDLRGDYVLNSDKTAVQQERLRGTVIIELTPKVEST